MFEFDENYNLINFSHFRKIIIKPTDKTFSIIGIGDVFETILFSKLPSIESAQLRLYRIQQRLNGSSGTSD